MATHEPPVESRLTLGPEDHGRPISADEFASAEYREPWEYERVGGRLVVMSPGGQQHNDGTRPWRRLLGQYWNTHLDLVEDVLPGAWVRVGGGNDRIGDIGVYLVARGEVPPVPDRVPELMFEIVSPDRKSRQRDFVEEREEYYRLGIREYVVIDRYTRRVTVFTHAAAGYEERVLTEADTYTSPLLPGLAILLAEVF
jgi:Uma2 family endonuclease